ncbi:MAG: heme NO-binding domain-containing protein [Candidatus Aenigmatarchaeota archaeon]|nr:MAG: heme NO-binding domain-containing protein [Candidatus Aenigmarchaeota archaeon]
MHGIIFIELKKYATEKMGSDGWEKLLREAKLEDRLYVPTEAYPDEEVSALVGAAVKISGASVDAILEDFGRFIAKELVSVYGALVNPDWTTLDLIENTESVIHTVVRTTTPGATPPEIKVERTSTDAAVVTYTSKRKMCSLAKGLMKGLADHYGEELEIKDEACMLKGDALCVMRVKRV